MLIWRGRRVPPPHALGLGKLLNPRGASFSACSKLFVGALSYDTNETVLKDAFSQYGAVIEVKVICHPVTAKSKGYGFVRFSSHGEAAAALEKMNGQSIDGRNIRVHYANNG